MTRTRDRAYRRQLNELDDIIEERDNTINELVNTISKVYSTSLNLKVELEKNKTTIPSQVDSLISISYNKLMELDKENEKK